MIPISDLMQVNHPGYRVFCMGHDMTEVHYPVFLDYCVNVCERFRVYAHQHNGSVIVENSIMQVIECLKNIDETDEPEDVFPLREQIRNSCYEFKSHCDDMGSKFTRPDAIAEFYDRIADLVIDVTFTYAGVESLYGNEEMQHE